MLLKIKEDLKDVDEFGEVEKEILNVMDVDGYKLKHGLCIN
jgi:hypothetical protein